MILDARPPSRAYQGVTMRRAHRGPGAARLTAAGLLSAAVVLGTAGTAAADPVVDGSVTVQPNPVAPGHGFAVYGTNCADDTGTVRFEPPSGGAALPDLELSMLSNALGATGSVPEGTGPGGYRVLVDCDDTTYEGTLTVAAGAASLSPSSSPSATPSQSPSVSSTSTPSAQPTASATAPQGGVRTGSGGTSSTVNPAVWAAGGAVVMALIGGGLWYRRHGQA